MSNFADVFVDIFRRYYGGSTPPIPEIPVNRFPTTSDDVDEDAPDGRLVGEGYSKALFISYVDAKGVKSERRISVNKLKQTKDGKLILVAYCYEREARRSFRVDRIIEMIDLLTGEIFENQRIKEALFSHFIPLVNQTAEDRVIGMCKDEMMVLAFLARCDGHYHSEEEAIIVSFISEKCFEEDFDDAEMRRRIKDLYPDKSEYFAAIDRISQREKEKRRLAKYAVRLIEADGTITDHEHSFILEINNSMSC
ncbi:MAG: hypothetical protein DCC73_14510 [Proteobacteria bacterium]|nr:MAG: hypothetical protein DCC73_14510 [Pseudomonadota bacterium]